MLSSPKRQKFYQTCREGLDKSYFKLLYLKLLTKTDSG